MKTLYKVIFSLIIFLSSSFPQNIHTLMNYNLLNYPGSTSSIRNPYFIQTINYIQPDILVVQEMTSQAGVNEFLNNVLLQVDTNYKAGIFLDGPDTDNEIFYKSDIFTFISNNPIPTDLRDISEFKIYNNITLDTLIIFSVHLKASSGSSNEQQRAAEVAVLRNVTNMLPSGSNFIVCGDFNIYGSSEEAYQKLLNQTNPGYFIDYLNLPGIWNDADYAPYHTQSTRTRQFGGGATGGLDDRFDLILYSQALSDPGGIVFIDSLFTAVGNDGNHYNDSINQPPNNAVPQEIADALEFSSDHLPVLAFLKFGDILPVELIAFNAFNENNTIRLDWLTETEINNKGFEVERLNMKSEIPNPKWKRIGFVHGYGTSTQKHDYTFLDSDKLSGTYSYRLKQIDFNGSFIFSKTININVINKFQLSQNYPNPFNPSTSIQYTIGNKQFVTLKIYDVLGREVKVLVNKELEPGSYSVYFSGSNFPSGIYFYKLTAGNFVQVKKMILVK